MTLGVGIGAQYSFQCLLLAPHHGGRVPQSPSLPQILLRMHQRLRPANERDSQLSNLVQNFPSFLFSIPESAEHPKPPPKSELVRMGPRRRTLKPLDPPPEERFGT